MDRFIISVGKCSSVEAISSERIDDRDEAISASIKLTEALKLANFTGFTVEVINDTTADTVHINHT